ncbi:MAG: methyltransferase type 11 [bacterium]|nr:methyltransferase type 11 [bacterium]MCM1375725.1 hypothetical protein [Muribaculum sp.]
MTNNPWESIKLSDYENHMKLHTVMQLQALNEMMKEQLSAYPVQSVMILGVAGGNGLEHINPQKYRAVYGVDVNGEYLREVQKRYQGLADILHCLCLDLRTESDGLPAAELLIANLLVEYIGCDCFQRIVERVRPKVVSCGIQLDTGEEFVSDSPYLHAFDGLGGIHSQINAAELGRTVCAAGYTHLGTKEYPLPNRKKLLHIDFEVIEEG